MVTVKEEGFSLLELTTAIGLAAILSTAVVTMSPSFIEGIKTSVEEHSNCSQEKESAAKKFIEGEEFTGWDDPSSSECNVDGGV